MRTLRFPPLFTRTGFKVTITLFLIIYLAILFYTDYSLTGFWTDAIFSLLLSAFVLQQIFKKNMEASWRPILIRTLTIACFISVFNLIALCVTNPFAFDHLKLRSFYFQLVKGRLFHAYFKPVGAYSGGQGNFWISESPLFFPLIEKRVYYDRTVHHDFSDDYWEGEPIDNYKVVREYVKKVSD